MFDRGGQKMTENDVCYYDTELDRVESTGFHVYRNRQGASRFIFI